MTTNKRHSAKENMELLIARICIFNRKSIHVVEPPLPYVSATVASSTLWRSDRHTRKMEPHCIDSNPLSRVYFRKSKRNTNDHHSFCLRSKCLVQKIVRQAFVLDIDHATHNAAFTDLEISIWHSNLPRKYGVTEVPSVDRCPDQQPRFRLDGVAVFSTMIW